MSQVDKIHRFPNHGPIDPPPLLLRLGFLYHTAAQLVPKFTHVPRWFQFHSAARGPRGLLLCCLERPLLAPFRCHNTLGCTQQDGARGRRVLGTLGWAVRGPAFSDPEKPAGPGSEAGRRAHGSLPQAGNPAPLRHRGARLELVGGGEGRRAPARGARQCGVPGLAPRCGGEPRAGRQWGGPRAETAATRLRNPSGWGRAHSSPSPLGGGPAPGRAREEAPGAPEGAAPLGALRRGDLPLGTGPSSWAPPPRIARFLGAPGIARPNKAEPLKPPCSPYPPRSRVSQTQRAPPHRLCSTPQGSRARFRGGSGARVGRGRDWIENLPDFQKYFVT